MSPVCALSGDLSLEEEARNVYGIANLFKRVDPFLQLFEKNGKYLLARPRKERWVGTRYYVK